MFWSLRAPPIVVTTDSNHGRMIYPNRARDLVLTGINQLWIADLTYIRLAEEFVFLAALKSRVVYEAPVAPRPRTTPLCRSDAERGRLIACGTRNQYRWGSTERGRWEEAARR